MEEKDFLAILVLVFVALSFVAAAVLGHLLAKYHG